MGGGALQRAVQRPGERVLGQLRRDVDLGRRLRERRLDHREWVIPRGRVYGELPCRGGGTFAMAAAAAAAAASGATIGRAGCRAR